MYGKLFNYCFLLCLLVWIGPKENAPVNVCNTSTPTEIFITTKLLDLCVAYGGQPGLTPNVYSNINAWQSGGTDTCNGFTGSIVNYDYHTSTNCSGSIAAVTPMLPISDTCMNVKKGRCSNKCAEASLYPYHEDLVNKYCVSPTDICITGYLQIVQ